MNVGYCQKESPPPTNDVSLNPIRLTSWRQQQPFNWCWVSTYSKVLYSGIWVISSRDSQLRRRTAHCSYTGTTNLTLILLTRRIWWAHNNASKWQMGFNSAFKGLIRFWINYLPQWFSLTHSHSLALSLSLSLSLSLLVSLSQHKATKAASIKEIAKVLQGCW